MSLLLLNSTPAERLRGCKFSEKFRNNQEFLENGGTPFGSPIIKNGAQLNGTDYTKHQLLGSEFYGDTTIKFTFVPDFEASDNATHYLFDTGGTGRFRILKFSNNALNFYGGNNVIIKSLAVGDYEAYWRLGRENNLFVTFPLSGNSEAYLNGNLIYTQATSLTRVQITTLSLGAVTTGASPFVGKICDFKTFGALLTAEDIQSYEDSGYSKYTILDLPMLSGQHDPDNVRTLDMSGIRKPAVFGDGVTPSTYPTKLQKRGYSFDGTADVLNGESALDITGLTGITMCVFFADNGLVGTDGLFSILHSASDDLRIYTVNKDLYIATDDGTAYSLNLGEVAGGLNFVALTYSDTNGLKGYLNNNLTGSNPAATFDFSTAVGTYQIGKTASTALSKVDILKASVYKTELSALEIADIYANFLKTESRV